MNEPEDMWIGWIEIDVMLGDVHSLKMKRSLVRPVVAELKKKFSVAAAETGHHDLFRRAEIGASSIASNREFLVDLFSEIEDHLAFRPELTVLSTRARIIHSEDIA